MGEEWEGVGEDPLEVAEDWAIAAILEDWGDAEVWAVAVTGVIAVGAASAEIEEGEVGEG